REAELCRTRRLDIDLESHARRTRKASREGSALRSHIDEASQPVRPEIAAGERERARDRMTAHAVIDLRGSVLHPGTRRVPPLAEHAVSRVEQGDAAVLLTLCHDVQRHTARRI